jgi:hypothetical protein
MVASIAFPLNTELINNNVDDKHIYGDNWSSDDEWSTDGKINCYTYFIEDRLVIIFIHILLKIGWLSFNDDMVFFCRVILFIGA